MNQLKLKLAWTSQSTRNFATIMSARNKLLMTSCRRISRQFSATSLRASERNSDTSSAEDSHTPSSNSKHSEHSEHSRRTSPKAQFSAVFDKMIASKKLFEPDAPNAFETAPPRNEPGPFSAAQNSNSTQDSLNTQAPSSGHSQPESAGVDVSQLKTKLLFSEIFDKIIGSKDVFDSTPRVSLKSALLSEKVGPLTPPAPILNDTSTKPRNMPLEVAQPVDRHALNYLYPWLNHIQGFEYSHEVVDYFVNTILSAERTEQEVPTELPDTHDSNLDNLIVNAATAPLLLDSCLKVLLSNFKDPNSCLLLVQAVKRRGHEDYLYFCDASVFATLISMRWIYYRSIPDILDLVAEMARNVIPFTTGTRIALSEIMKQINGAKLNGTLNRDGIPLWAVDQFDSLERVTKTVTRQLFDTKQREATSLYPT